MLKGLLKSPAFLFGAGLFVLTLLIAFVLPLFMSFDAKTRVGLAYLAPSGAHWLGTDHLGLDMVSRLVAGLRSSLYVGFLAGIVATVVGTLIGVYGGYKGGFLDDLLTAFTNLFLVIPQLILLILLSASLQEGRSRTLIALIIGLTGWTWSARAVRAQASSLRSRAYSVSAVGWDRVHESFPGTAGAAAPPGDLRESERGQCRERGRNCEHAERHEVQNRQHEHDCRHPESAQQPARDEERERERRSHRHREEDAEEGRELIGAGVREVLRFHPDFKLKLGQFARWRFSHCKNADLSANLSENQRRFCPKIANHRASLPILAAGVPGRGTWRRERR